MRVLKWLAGVKATGIVVLTLLPRISKLFTVSAPSYDDLSVLFWQQIPILKGRQIPYLYYNELTDGARLRCRDSAAVSSFGERHPWILQLAWGNLNRKMKKPS